MFRRREERQEDRQIGAVQGNHHYQMRERLATFGDDFWIEDDRGNRAFKVYG